MGSVGERRRRRLLPCAAWLAIGAMAAACRLDPPRWQPQAGGPLSGEGLLSLMLPASAPPWASLRRRPRARLPSDVQGFERMWRAHPHVSELSEDIREVHGLPDYLQNTCGVRFSIMLNETGHAITPAKAAAAGLPRRPHYSKKTKQYYIVSAKELLDYLTQTFRPADRTFPASGKYASPEEFEQELESTIKPLIRERKGIVVFEKIFSYDGTGHVDLFDGETLSASTTWYSCTRLHLWYLVVP